MEGAARSRGALARFALRRIASAAGLLLAVTVVGFLLLDIVPGNPAEAALGSQSALSPSVIQAYDHKWGLDQPLPVRYWVYLSHVLEGNLGISQVTSRPVATDLRTYVPATLEITIPALVISLIVSGALGLWAAMRKDRGPDRTIRVVSLLGVSVPPFWLAIIALFVLAYGLGWLPPGGRLSSTTVPPPTVTGFMTVDSLIAGQWSTFWDAVGHLILPVCVLSAYTIGILTRFARSAVLDVLDREYVQAAWAKGLPARIVLRRHILRPALISIITVAGTIFGTLLAGAVLVERVFSWPGLGTYAYTSAESLDLPAILGVTLVVAAMYIMSNTIVDLLYVTIDPRITVE